MENNRKNANEMADQKMYINTKLYYSIICI